jgi:hypothetical protein
LTLANSHATRLGGGRLSIDRPITATGFAALAFDIGHSILGIRYWAFDIAICTLSNFMGFYLLRLLIVRFKFD